MKTKMIITFLPLLIFIFLVSISSAADDIRSSNKNPGLVQKIRIPGPAADGAIKGFQTQVNMARSLSCASADNGGFSELMDESAADTNKEASATPAYKPGEIIVKVKEGYSVSDLDSLNTQYNAASPQKAFPMYVEPQEKLDTLKKELADLSEGHNSWYWQLDKNSDEYKKYEERLAAEKKALADQIKREAETVARFEAYNAECVDGGSTTPGLERIYLLKLDSSVDPKQLAAIYGADPAVEYAHPNYIARINMIPNDTYYASSGAWKQPFRDLWGVVKTQADKAWDTTQGEGVVVAVSDTGVDYNHPDLKANMWKDKNGSCGYNFVADNTDPMDDFGHGTHCAGTIAAVGNNNIGIIGIAPKAKIMAVKGLDNTGSGYMSDLAQTIQYAADNGADVISCSWGGPEDSEDSDCMLLCDTVRYATNIRNSVVVAAAGNDDMNVGSYNIYPANIKEVITVAASTSEDKKAEFSNYGAKIDVSAPGGGDIGGKHPERSILSLKASLAVPDILGGKSAPLVIGGNYLRQAGTSMACPHVSGVAALVKSLHRDFTPEQVRQAIRAGSDDILYAGFDTYSGYGRVNALGAISILPIAPVIIEPSVRQWDNADTIPIKFTVKGSNVASWKIEYSDVKSTWRILTQGTGPVNTPAVFDWDIRAIPDGPRTIRLVAVNSQGKIFESKTDIYNNHVTVTKPQNHFSDNYYGPGKNVVIEGTVNPYGLTSYTLSIYKLEEDASFVPGKFIGYTSGKSIPVENTVVNLANGGKAPVINGRIAEWDIRNIPAGYYRIQLNVFTQTSGTSPTTRKVMVEVDPSLHPGWPLHIPIMTDGGWTSPPVNIFTAADINGDGRDEILFNYSGQINVMDSNGASLPGWPRTFASAGDTSQNGVTIGDVMGTGKPQIIVGTCGGQIHLFDRAGNLVKKFPEGSRSSYGVNPAVAVSDIDMDGKNEMVITAGMNLYVVGRDGEKWSEELSATHEPGENCLFQPTVADLDGNGEKEIIVQSMFYGNEIHVFDCKGNIMHGWPKKLCPPSWYWDGYSSAPIAADVDKDGILEILTAANNNKIYIFKPDGTILAGWPLQFDINDILTLGQIVVGDLDKDGNIEIVVGGPRIVQGWNSKVGNVLYVFRANGTVYNSAWPVCRMPNGFGVTWVYGLTPTLADINNDGLPEIIINGVADFFRGESFNVYDINGREIKELRKPILGFTAWPANCPVVGDFSGSGKNQILWLARGYVCEESSRNTVFYSSSYYDMYLWNTDTPSTNPRPWPMFHCDSRHAGAIPANVASPFKAPSDLRVINNTSTMVELSWKNNSALITDFEIERKAAVGGAYAKIDEVKAKNTSYKDKKVPSGVTCFYRVRAAKGSAYRSKYSNEVNVDTVLPGPSGLTATAVSSMQINLAWLDNSKDERKFCVERKTGAGGTYVEIHRTASNHANYKDNRAIPGTTYYYRVRAINKKGAYSEYSDVASAITLLPAPSGLTATAISKKAIKLYWTDNSKDEKNFLIERKLGANGTYAQIHKTGPKDNDYKDTQLSAGTTYYYRVRVVNKSAYSEYSNEAHAATNR
ncbi:MAG: S8 family serine peptidase [Candidatus Omnitrophota bacterium]